MTNFGVVKHLNIIGILTIILLGVLVVLEIFDFVFFSELQSNFFAPSEKIIFDHLKRLFIIGIFFTYSISHFYFITKKYPALATKINRRILIFMRFLAIMFVLMIGFRIYMLFSIDYPHIKINNLEEFLEQREVAVTMIEDVATSNNNIDFLVVNQQLVDFLSNEQMYNKTEKAYCLYGHKMLPVNKGWDGEDDYLIIEGLVDVGEVVANQSLLSFKPCLEDLYYSEVTHLFFIHGDVLMHGNDTPINLVGLVHTHPSLPQDSIFQIQPEECRLSAQDTFSFAGENSRNRAWVWGLVCSTQKLFFYSTADVNQPIDLLIVQ